MLLLVRHEDHPIGQILSSPAVRRHETVRRLADDRLLPVEPLPAVAVAADGLRR